MDGQHPIVISLMALPLYLSLILLPLALLLLRWRSSKSNTNLNLPPGPWQLPIIGNLHQLGSIPHRSLTLLAKRYGPLMRLQLCRIPTVVVSSSEVAKEVLKTHDLAFCTRPSLTAFRYYFYNSSDVASGAYGESWRELRKLFILELLTIKRSSSFVSVREDETGRTMRSLSASPSPNPVDLTELVTALASNIICRVAFGKRFEKEGSGFHGILLEAQALIAGFVAADYFPGHGWLDVLTGQRRRLERNYRELDAFYQMIIDEHLKPERRARDEDITDVLLRLRDEGRLTEDQVKASISDLFFAGTDTSAATLVWAMSELIRYPNAMNKAQDEVRRLVGNKGKVEESDVPQLEYLKLVINETLRLHPPLPLLIPRESMQHCNINGYDIPPKTRVLVNAWAIGRDEDLWENPNEFIPDRFEDSSISFNGHDFSFLPFGSGRRICPGINFGIATVGLILANLLYTFDWDLPAGMKREDVNMDEALGILTHKKFNLCLVAKRHL